MESQRTSCNCGAEEAARFGLLALRKSGVGFAQEWHSANGIDALQNRNRLCRTNSKLEVVTTFYLLLRTIEVQRNMITALAFLSYNESSVVAGFRVETRIDKQV